MFSILIENKIWFCFDKNKKSFALSKMFQKQKTSHTERFTFLFSKFLLFVFF